MIKIENGCRKVERNKKNDEKRAELFIAVMKKQLSKTKIRE